MNEVTKYIFFFLVGSTILNFGIALCARVNTKSKEFNPLITYWSVLFINFFFVAILHSSTTEIAFAYYVQFIPTMISASILMRSRGMKINYKLYFTSFIIGGVLSAYFLLYTKLGFTLSLMPVTFANALPLFPPMWNALVTNRHEANWIEKAMGFMFITAIINHFNFPLFRLNESAAWWGWSVAFAQYQCLSVFLPLLINYRRSQIERRNVELALKKLSSPVSNYNVEIDELYRSLELHIGQKEEMNRKLHLSNQNLEEEREMNEILIKTISHDLANPLTVINAYMDMLHAGRIPENERAMIWERIKLNTKSALDMIARIRDAIVTRNQASIVAIHDVSIDRSLKRLMNQFESFTREKNIKINYQTNVPLDVFVLAEENTLTEHVFANILSNAIKFSFEDSVIEIKVSDTDSQVKIEFQDFGTGISRDRLDKRLLHSTPGTKGEIGSGFGMMVLGYYLRKFNATYQIYSEGLNRGTSITVNLKKSSRNHSMFSSLNQAANNFS